MYVCVYIVNMALFSKLYSRINSSPVVIYFADLGQYVQLNIMNGSEGKFRFTKFFNYYTQSYIGAIIKMFCKCTFSLTYLNNL